MNRFLKSERGRRYLYDQYITKQRSALSIAEELGVNHYYVLEALHYHEIQVRTLSEAMKIAHRNGTYVRLKNEMSESTKKKISTAARRRWDRMTQEEKDERLKKLKEGYQRYAESPDSRRRVGIDERLGQRDGSGGTSDVSGGNGEQR